MSRKENPRLYRIWNGMKYRCYSQSKWNTKARWYRDKGITVCDEWRHDFSLFEKWAMENGYQDDLTIDRIDPSGNYEPNNCQWITRSENCSKRWDDCSSLPLSKFDINEQIAIKFLEQMRFERFVYETLLARQDIVELLNLLDGASNEDIKLICAVIKRFGKGQHGAWNAESTNRVPKSNDP